MLNSSEFLEIFLPAARPARSWFPSTSGWQLPELIYILKDSAPHALVYSSDFAEKVQAIKAAGLPMEHYFRHGGINWQKIRRLPTLRRVFQPMNRSLSVK